MKYRKKPVEIEAMQYDGKNGYEIREWSDDAVIESPVLEPREGNPTGEYLQIHTLEGTMTAIVGDWIIKGIKDEFHPVKDPIFRETYEPVENGGQAMTTTETAWKPICVNCIHWILSWGQSDSTSKVEFPSNKCEVSGFKTKSTDTCAYFESKGRR